MIFCELPIGQGRDTMYTMKGGNNMMIDLETAIKENLPEDLIRNIREHGSIDAIRDTGDSVITVYADGFTEIRNKGGNK